jgi:hypothetical protein
MWMDVHLTQLDVELDVTIHIYLHPIKLDGYPYISN